MSRGADWIHPPTRLAIIWFRDGGRCLACGWKPDARFAAGLVIDHLIPTTRWAECERYHAPIRPSRPHDPRNLATLCAPCNDRKYDNLPEEAFTARVARRLWERARRPLTRWHRRRGYLAALRLGRYRVKQNATRCRAYREGRAEAAYVTEERAALAGSVPANDQDLTAEPWARG